MKVEKVKIGTIKLNPNNPRLIKDEKYKKLVQSLKDFPEMMQIRPIVVNSDNIVLGGNMRLRATKEAGWKEVPVIKTDLSEEKQREFIIKDNIGFGEWEWDLLANEWDAEELENWGLDVWRPEDFTEANKEIDVDGLDGEMSIKLNYSEDEYWKVKEALYKVAETPGMAVYKLLKL